MADDIVIRNGTVVDGSGLGSYRADVGITGDRIETISWGKERPFCTEHDESCWQQNRRAHFVMSH